MNIEVTAVHTSCAVRALSQVTATLNPGSSCERVSAMGATGVTSMAACNRVTRMSIEVFWASLEYSPYCRIIGSSRLRLKICCCMLESRWLMSEVSMEVTYFSGTDCCSISTRVWDLYLTGKKRDTP